MVFLAYLRLHDDAWHCRLSYCLLSSEVLGHALQDTSVLYQYRYDWADQFWAANILLATLTDGGTFHAQAQSFLKFWICGTDEVCALHHCLNILLYIGTGHWLCRCLAACLFELQDLGSPVMLRAVCAAASPSAHGARSPAA